MSASPVEMRKLRPTEVSEQEWPFSIGITWCVHTAPCEPQGTVSPGGPTQRVTAVAAGGRAGGLGARGSRYPFPSLGHGWC